MSDVIVGIDVSKETLDANSARASGSRAESSRIIPMAGIWCCPGSRRLEQQTSSYLHGGDRSSQPRRGAGAARRRSRRQCRQPSADRDFARTKLGRNKNDKVDAALIREYAELFKPGPWTPPSTAMRRLCELQTIRAGIVSNRAEWKNRIGNSGLADATCWLAAATIEHFTTTARGDRQSHRRNDRPGRRGLHVADATCCSVSSVSAKRWPPRCWRRCRSRGFYVESGEIVACAGSTRATRSGTSIDRPTPYLPRSAMPRCGRRSTCRRCPRCVSIPPSRLS